MKTLALTLTIICFAPVAGFAQNYALRFWSNELSTTFERSNGIAGSLVSESRHIGAQSAIPPGFSFVTNAAGLAQLTKPNRPEMVAWKLKYKQVNDAKNTANKAAQRALVDEQAALWAIVAGYSTNRLQNSDLPDAVSNLSRLLIRNRELNPGGPALIAPGNN